MPLPADRRSRLAPLAGTAVLLALLVAAAACRPAPAPDVTIASGALATHLSRLAPTQAADSLGRARQARYVADRFRDAGLQPVLGTSFMLPHAGATPGPAGAAADASRAHQMGYLAGQNPRVRHQLVLVTADVGTLAGPALLEVARVLAQEASVTIVPGTTVGFLIFGAPRSGASGVADFVARPTWAVGNIARVLHVAPDTSGVSAMRAAWADAGIPLEVVEIPPAPGGLEAGREEAVRLGEAYRLTAATLDHVRRAAAAPLADRSTARP
jgi:hypothetical protein